MRGTVEQERLGSAANKVVGGLHVASLQNAKRSEEIEAAEDQAAERAKLISEYEDAFATPYQAASRGYVDKVILPEETRFEVIQALKAHRTKRQALPRKKHGVMPN